jgi:hypothetical protein
MALYDASHGLMRGYVDKTAGLPGRGGWQEFYTDNSSAYRVLFEGQEDHDYGMSTDYRIVGMGRSTYMGTDYYKELLIVFSNETYADYLYISHRERDSLRHEIIRFWTPDTLDGKVHSNDTIHIVATSDRPRFMKRVTTTMRFIDPANNHARFDEGWGAKTPIYFPDQADEIRLNSGVSGPDWGSIGPDSLVQIVLDGAGVRHRKCGLTRINGVDSITCDPPSIAASLWEPIPQSQVIFIYGKVWISGSRGRPMLLDGPVPERLNYIGYTSPGLQGQLTIGSSDTMIITDNIIYARARPNNSVPVSMDSCSDILGLVSERYIMVGKHVRDTVYINAALAAVSGSISVQDIYWNRYPGWDNEKQSLFIWGSLAQRNRGIVHTTDYPLGHLRGFIEKDYHYDWRFKENPPPHFMPTLQNSIRFIES